MSSVETGIYRQQPTLDTQVIEKAADTALQGTIEITVNGVRRQVLPIPAGLRYTVEEAHFDILSHEGGHPTGNTVMSRSFFNLEVIPPDMPHFFPPVIFQELYKKGLIYRLEEIYNGVNPHALKKGFEPRAYIVGDVPYVIYVGKIQCEFNKREKNIWEIGHSTIGYALEYNPIERFARESGLTAQNERVEETVKSDETQLNNFPFSNFLYEIGMNTLFSFRTNLLLLQLQTEDPNQTQDSRNHAINTLNKFKRICGDDIWATLLKEGVEEIDEAYTKYAAILNVRNILKNLPSYVFVKPEYIPNNIQYVQYMKPSAFRAIARSIQSYYDQLGGLPDFTVSHHYEQIWQRALETYSSSLMEENQLVDHQEDAKRFRKQVIHQAMNMIAASK